MNQSAVNFLPEDYVEKRTSGRWTLICIGLCVAVMGVVIGTFFVMLHAQMAAQQTLDQVTQQYDEVGKKLTELQTLEHEKQTMMAKAEVTAVLLERVPRSVLLAELTQLMPKGVSLISLELNTKELEGPRPSKPDDGRRQSDGTPVPQQPAPPIREVTVELVGVAPTDGHVAAFISKLDKSPLLQDVNLIYSEEFKNDEELLRRFRVEMKINPNADIRNTTPDTNKSQKG